MHPADIQAELKKREITQKLIAEELGVCEFHVSAVIRGIRESDRVMKFVSEKINHDYREVFPEYYFRKTRRKKVA